MSTITASRSRASLAFATALALVAAMFSIGVSPASADPLFATVTGHEKFSSDANKVDYWCAERRHQDGPRRNLVRPPRRHLLPGDRQGRIRHSTQTRSLLSRRRRARRSGPTRTATDLQPGRPGGDKGISHVILCNGVPETPETTDLTVDKVWEYSASGLKDSNWATRTLAILRSRWPVSRQARHGASQSRAFRWAPRPRFWKARCPNQGPGGLQCKITGAADVLGQQRFPSDPEHAVPLSRRPATRSWSRTA